MRRVVPIESWDAAGARLRVRTGGAPAPARGARTLLHATDPPNVVEAYAELFVALGQALPGARLVAFEPPGFGRSRAPKGFGYAWREQVDVLEALAARVGPCVLAFPCVSAYAGLALAARRPDLVEGLVLSQAPAWPDEKAWMARVDRNRLVRTPLVGQAVMALRAEGVAQKWYEAASGDVDKMRPLARMSVEALTHDAKFPLADAFQAMDREDPPLAVVDKPALLVWGDKDRTHRGSDPDGLAALLPRARRATLEGAGHFPELERPRGYAEAVAAWLREA